MRARMHSMGYDPEDEEWKDGAKCASLEPDLFFPNNLDQARDAVRVCQECPVKDECRAYAKKYHIDHGVWGGVWLDPGKGRNNPTTPNKMREAEKICRICKSPAVFQGTYYFCIKDNIKWKALYI